MKLSAMVMIKLSLKERFQAKMSYADEKGCMNWIGAIRPNGYGCLSICEKASTYKYNSVQSAHRVSYELFVGKIPKGICVLHKCDNRKCVNPEHLFLGTQKDNADDMMNKNRGHMKLGQNHFGAKLQKKDIPTIFNLSAHFTQREIAKKFNVSQCAIQNILNHKTWTKEGANLINLTPKVRRPNQNGSKNIRAKISENDALYILKSKGSKSARELGIEFKVTEGSIRNIWSRKTWTHIEEVAS